MIPFGDYRVVTLGPSPGAPTTGTWEQGAEYYDSNGSLFICMVAGTPGTWSQPPSWPSIDGTIYNQPDFFDTFVNGVNAPWTTSLSNGTLTAVATPGSLLNRQRVIGVAQASTGTNAAGRAGAILGPALVHFDPDVGIWTQWSVNIPVLSTAAQRFRFRCGFLDDATATEPVDGLYFEYEEAVSPNWLMKARSSNTETQIDTLIPVAIDAWTQLYMQWNGHGPYVNATINGAWAQNMPVTDVPTAAGRETSLGFVLHKTAGTTARVVNIDSTVLRSDQW